MPDQRAHLLDVHVGEGPDVRTVEEGRVVGVVSRKDVTAEVARSDEQVDSEEDRRIAQTLATIVRGVAGVRFR